MTVPTINKTLDYEDLRDPDVSRTATSLKRWVWRWLFTGGELGVNGHVKRRFYIRRHKMWEYSRGLALTEIANGQQKVNVLDVGGAMTAPVFYLAGCGHNVVCLDIDPTLTGQLREIASNRKLPIKAETTNLGDENVSADDLGAPDGFDRIYSFCVIEHVPHPMQFRLVERMAGLLKPGGEMCITFDYGEDAPTEAPLYSLDHVNKIKDAIGLPLKGNQEFADNGKRFPLEKHAPEKKYTFGSLFFQKP